MDYLPQVSKNPLFTEFCKSLIITEGSLWPRGRWPLRSIPQLEVTQDSFNGGAVVDQADNIERAAATGTQQGIGFVNPLNQPRPGAPYGTSEFVLGIRGLSRLGRCTTGWLRAGAAHMGPLPVIPDQLLAGIGDMRAKSGEKMEGRTGGSGRRIGTGAAIVVSMT